LLLIQLSWRRTQERLETKDQLKNVTSMSEPLSNFFAQLRKAFPTIDSLEIEVDNAAAPTSRRLVRVETRLTSQVISHRCGRTSRRSAVTLPSIATVPTSKRPVQLKRHLTRPDFSDRWDSWGGRSSANLPSIPLRTKSGEVAPSLRPPLGRSSPPHMPLRRLSLENS
jgi:hypothetical protein